MTARAALVLGLFLLLAAFVHGGLYSAGHDFVVNRFTGTSTFVPVEDEGEATWPARRAHARGALTSIRPGDRVVELQGRR